MDKEVFPAHPVENSAVPMVLPEVLVHSRESLSRSLLLSVAKFCTKLIVCAVYAGTRMSYPKSGRTGE